MTKITPEHLARGAFIYVRQSTSDQAWPITRADAVMAWRDRARAC